MKPIWGCAALTLAVCALVVAQDTSSDRIVVPATKSGHPRVVNCSLNTGTITVKTHAGNVVFAFRHFPLEAAHPHALMAAQASEAAAAQGQFWPMHDILFENQDSLAEEYLPQYAAAIDLDVEQFARDLSEERFAPRVREHFMGGVHSGVNGTPTFFINGVRHDGGLDYQSLLEAVNEHL